MKYGHLSEFCNILLHHRSHCWRASLIWWLWFCLCSHTCNKSDRIRRFLFSQNQLSICLLLSFALQTKEWLGIRSFTLKDHLPWVRLVLGPQGSRSWSFEPFVGHWGSDLLNSQMSHHFIKRRSSYLNGPFRCSPRYCVISDCSLDSMLFCGCPGS